MTARPLRRIVRPSISTTASTAACLLILAGCASAPPEPPPPAAALSLAFKEAPAGWIDAAPADTLERGPWWRLFDDSVLSDLVARVAVSNQNVASAAAAYAQARAVVREQRAALFPTLSASGGVTRNGGGGANVDASRYQVGLAGSWEADVWGRVAGSVSAARAQAQASAADLAAATLAAQGELATAYFSLRETDVEAGLLRTTIVAYERALRITQNRYEAGIAARTDLLQAQTQLANARAEEAGLEQQRAQLEHAMATLVGEAPSQFAVTPVPASAALVPTIPGLLPSALLQRRPDIAAAERRVAAANASVGVARAAFFPSIGLSGSAGLGAARLGDLVSASAASWSLGLSLVQTLFDAGARSARVDQARAAWEQSVAQYRQSVLSAFQDVEDQLAAARVLAQQEVFRRQASEAANLAEQQMLNRYNAGQVAYSDVVTTQVAALNARRVLAQLAASRQNSAVSLIRALGGGWQASALEGPGLPEPAGGAASAAPRP